MSTRINRAQLGHLLLAAAVLLGCGQLLPAAPTATPVPGTSQPAAGTAATAPAAATGTPAAAEPLPPADFLEALQEKVDAGAWTYEEGLIATLMVFSGENTPEQLFGARQPEDPGFTSLLAAANIYAESGSDAAARAEIQRLLDVVLPDAERLLAYAQPAPPRSGQRASGVAAPPRQPLPLECRELAADAFPVVEPPIQCFQYLSVPLPDGTLRVFYPLDWWPGDPRLDLADAVASSVVLSTNTYNKFTPGTMRSVDVVFALLSHPTSPKAFMGTTPRGGEPICRIAVYPPGAELTAELDTFEIIMAHEMFHCYESWNLAAQYDGASPGINGWWIEGAATYFMNVVYPTVNEEWVKVPRFDQNSVTRPIHQMSYEDFIFFHYLANRDGDQSVIDLLQAVPESNNPADHAQALAAYPGMQELLQEFGRAYLDGAIADRGGGLIPTHFQVGAPERITISANTTAFLEAPPLVLRRYLITFAAKKRFGLQTSESGVPGLSGARPAAAPGGWPGLPPEAGAGCAAEQYLYLGTTGTPGVGTHVVAVEATELENLGCDACLFGTWDLDKASYAAFFETTLSAAGPIELDTVEGSLRLRFSKDGQYSSTFDDLTIAYTMQLPDAGGNPRDVAMEVLLTGVVSATYQTNDQGRLFTHNGSTNLTSQVTMDGQALPGQPIDPGNLGALGDDNPYSCSGNRLTIGREAGGQVFNLQYDRVPGAP